MKYYQMLAPKPIPHHFMWQRTLSVEAQRSLMCSDWNNLSVWWPKMAWAITYPLGFLELWGVWEVVYIEPSAVKAFSLLNMWMNWGKKSGRCFSNDYGICKLNFLVNLTASWAQQQKLRYVGAGSSLMRTSFSGVREDVAPNAQNKGYEVQAALYSHVSVYATVVY